MGFIINENAKMEKLYSAYGYTVNGKMALYEWTIVLNNEVDNCITEIEILKDNNIIYHEYMGNKLVLEKIFKKHIDNILWHIDHENITDSYRLEKLVDKVLINNDSMFSHMIENKKRAEKEDNERKARQEEARKERETLETSIKEESEKRNLYVFDDYGTVHILRLFTDCRELLNRSNHDSMKSYIEYAKSGKFKELEYVKEVDSLESALEYIKTIKIIDTKKYIL